MVRNTPWLAALVLALAPACTGPASGGDALSQALHAGDVAHDDRDDRDDSDGDHKCTICHRPPGNPDNARTLHIGCPAVDAHLAHGDALGACDADDGDSDSDSDETCDAGAPIDAPSDAGVVMPSDDAPDAGHVVDAGCEDAGQPAE